MGPHTRTVAALQKKSRWPQEGAATPRRPNKRWRKSVTRGSIDALEVTRQRPAVIVEANPWQLVPRCGRAPCAHSDWDDSPKEVHAQRPHHAHAFSQRRNPRLTHFNKPFVVSRPAYRPAAGYGRLPGRTSWTPHQQCCLWSSLLLGYPVPSENQWSGCSTPAQRTGGGGLARGHGVGAGGGGGLSKKKNKSTPKLRMAKLGVEKFWQQF